jgi:glycosyltransferase involved in cell wall biosynthesis
MTNGAGGRPPLARARRALGRWRRHASRAVRAVARSGPGRHALGAVEGVHSPRAGFVHVTGWAFVPGQHIESVIVLVDGEPRALAQLGEPRVDVAAQFRGARGSIRSGWSASIDAPERAGLAVTVSALVVTTDGLVERLAPMDLAVADNTARFGHLETPVSGSEVPADVVPIEGWALPPERLTRVEMKIDGRAAGLARPLATARPDLASSPVASAPLAGFLHTIDLTGYEVGETVRISCDIVTINSRRIPLGPVDVTVSPARAPAEDDGPSESLQAEVTTACARPSALTQPPVRLLVVTHRLDYGGGQFYLYDLLKHLLVELDISCLVVAAEDGPLHEQLVDLGATVHVCGDYPVGSPDQYEARVRDLGLLARERGCNVALVNTMGAAIGTDLASRLGIPAVWAVHESYTLGEYFFAAYGRDGIHPYVRERAVASLADAAAVVFEAEATRVQYAPNGDARRFITVPYGIRLADVDAYRGAHSREELRRASFVPDEATVLLCMGTYEPRKAQAALVLAFAEVAHDFPEALLVLVGDNGSPYARGVHEIVRRLALQDRVRLLPIVEDTYHWYAVADVFISASDVESLPRSVLEAMAFDVPVAAASVFGLPELIEDGATGMLFPPRDVDALVDAMRRVLSMTPTELASLAKAAAELIRTRHDSAIYAGAYRVLLRGLLSDPDALPAELLEE